MKLPSMVLEHPHFRLVKAAVRTAALAAGIAGLLTAPDAAAQSPFKLRYKLRPGDQYIYVINFSGRVKMDSPDKKPVPPISFTGRIRQERTVMQAHSNGSFTLGDRMASGVMTMNMMGQKRTVPLEPTPVQFSTINALGRMTLSPDQKAQMQLAGARLGFDPSELIAPFAALQAYPMEALSPGSKWQRKAGLKLPPHLSLNIVMNNKVVKAVTVLNRKTAEVSSTLQLPVNIQYADRGSSFKLNGGIKGAYRSNYALVNGMPMRMGGSMSGLILVKMNDSKFRGNPVGNLSGKMQFSLDLSMNMVEEKRGVDTSQVAAAQGTPLSARMDTLKAPIFGGSRPAPARIPVRTAASPSRTSPIRSAGVPQPSAAPEPPVRLWIPHKGGKVSRGEVVIQAVTPSKDKVESITFYVNGKLAHSTNALPYRFVWDTTDLPDGVYQIGVELHGDKGRSLYRSSARKVRVGPTAPAQAPLTNRPGGKQYPS